MASPELAVDVAAGALARSGHFRYGTSVALLQSRVPFWGMAACWKHGRLRRPPTVRPGLRRRRLRAHHLAEHAADAGDVEDRALAAENTVVPKPPSGRGRPRHRSPATPPRRAPGREADQSHGFGADRAGDRRAATLRQGGPEWSPGSTGRQPLIISRPRCVPPGRRRSSSSDAGLPSGWKPCACSGRNGRAGAASRTISAGRPDAGLEVDILERQALPGRRRASRATAGPRSFQLLVQDYAAPERRVLVAAPVTVGWTTRCPSASRSSMTSRG